MYISAHTYKDHERSSGSKHAKGALQCFYVNGSVLGIWNMQRKKNREKERAFDEIEKRLCIYRYRSYKGNWRKIQTTYVFLDNVAREVKNMGTGTLVETSLFLTKTL